MADPHDATAHISGGAAPSHTHASHTGIGAGDHHAEDHDHDGTPTQKLLAANSHESPSADTHHAKVHGDAEHPVMGRMVLIRKAADETISLNQTVQDDDELFFSIAANEVWTFTLSLVINSGTVPDWKYNIGVPAGASGFSSLTLAAAVLLAHGTDSASISQFAADRFTQLMGVVVNGSTAGTVQLKWAQNLLDAGNTTVKANSVLVAHRIA